MAADCPIIYAVILAAGTSSRFGSTKQLAELAGISMIRRVADVSSEACGDRVILITGADWRNVARSAAPACKYFAFNELFADGIGSSISLGARLCSQRADAMLLVLADQPLLTGAHLKNLMSTWSRDPNEIVASAYAGVIGPPVLFPRLAFPLLSELKGDTGARALFEDSSFRTVVVPFEDGATDIDTVADFQSACRSAGHR